MKVLLRHPEIGLYYVGHKHWVGHPSLATDLETIERATELSREESFDEMDILVSYDESCSDLILPLKRKKAAKAATRRLAA